MRLLRYVLFPTLTLVLPQLISAAPAADVPAVQYEKRATDVYLIFPKNSEDPGNAALTTQLERVFGNQLKIDSDAVTGIGYWSAPLNPAQVQEYQAHPLVALIVKNDVQNVNEGEAPPSHRRRSTISPLPHSSRHLNHLQKRDLIYQDTDREELIEISWPLGVDKLPRTAYVYDASSGSGITIYIVDRGLDITYTPELAGSARLRWLFVPNDEHSRPWTNTDADKTDNPDFHGTMLTAKAVGREFGIAKEANVVIVRRPLSLGTEDTMGNAVFASTWRVIERDVRERGLQGRFVVNYAFEIMFPPADRAFDLLMAGRFKQLENLGGVLVTAAGNTEDPAHSQVDGSPPIYSAYTSFITVGATDTDALPAPFSKTGPLVSVWAPGEDIMWSRDQPSVSGTSASCATVAGLAAYVLAKPALQRHIPTDLKLRGRWVRRLLQLDAYARIEGGVDVVWNMEKWTSGQEGLAGVKIPDAGDLGGEMGVAESTIELA